LGLLLAPRGVAGPPWAIGEPSNARLAHGMLPTGSPSVC
jgi:hypothetical protein